jgi:hypothetical protein
MTSTCVPDVCDAATMVNCPIGLPFCKAGTVPVTTRTSPCACPTTECKVCPLPACPEIACENGVVEQRADSGCPLCPTCAPTPCPLLGCPAPPLCGSPTVAKTTKPDIDSKGCPINCGSTVCCTPPACPVPSQLRCAPDQELRVSKPVDSRGCSLCEQQECVPKMCAEPICPLGFPSCAAPLVAKTIAKVDERTGCALCPEHVCVSADDCSASSRVPIACPALARPECPAGTAPVLVSTSANRCVPECPVYECQKVVAPICPRIACLAPELLQRCPPGTTPQTVATELASGCPGCPKVQCVASKCDSVALICPLGFPRCGAGEIAQTTTPTDKNGCPQCSVTTCVKMPRPVCALPACPEIAIKCARGFTARTFEQTDAQGCALCPQQVCVPDTCPALKCAAAAPCRGSSNVVATTAFDKAGCPTCPQTECIDLECPAIGCPDVLPSCADGEVPELLPQESDGTTCPTCPLYECRKKAECKPLSECARVECAAGERPVTPRGADGCATGCARCVPICSSECNPATRTAATKCKSGAGESRVVDANGCCSWKCVGDDAIVVDDPAPTKSDSGSAELATAATAAIVLAAAVAL